MSRYLTLAVAAVTLALGMTNANAADPRLKQVEAYVIKHIKPWIGDPVVVKAVNDQNVANAKLKSYDINKLDNSWMDRTNKALIDSKMHNALSTLLTAKRNELNKAAGSAVILEIFVFDKKGLNVGETDLTQDYNQGDEAKYWKTYGVGPDAIFIDDIEPDGGKPNISQASLTIKDPATGKSIGAMTVGIDYDEMIKMK